jgi:serine/threonine protein kinase
MQQQPSSLEIHERLGSGMFGDVYGLRDSLTKKPSDRILKISFLKDYTAVSTFSREVLYLRELQNHQWFDGQKWHPLAPKFFNSWIDRPHLLSLATRVIPQGTQTMERMDGTLTDLGLKQARKKLGNKQNKNSLRGVVGYTTTQIRKMVRLTFLLDHLGLVHGDLKRRNLLYKGSHGQTIVLSDFGFTGLLPSDPSSSSCCYSSSSSQSLPSLSFSTTTTTTGSSPASDNGSDVASLAGPHARFLEPRIGFPDLPRNRPRLPPELWPYVNRWQMYFDFVYNRPTYWIKPKKKKMRLMPCKVVQKMFGLPDWAVARFVDLYQLYPTNLDLPEVFRGRPIK